jgi:rRNA maturation RNase YbeY
MITYNSINVACPALDQPKVTEWINAIALSYGKKIDVVNYIFVDDEEILRINRQFIGHDYYTDHIGFDTSQGNYLSGDTYISIDTVCTNAQKFGTTFADELHRVIIHSILHLCGFEDHTPEDRQHMEEAENAALAILK